MRLRLQNHTHDLPLFTCTRELDRNRWNILGLCEVRWKNFGETIEHMVFFSAKEDKHERGVEFLVHKDIVNTVIGCRPCLLYTSDAADDC